MLFSSVAGLAAVMELAHQATPAGAARHSAPLAVVRTVSPASAGTARTATAAGHHHHRTVGAHATKHRIKPASAPTASVTTAVTDNTPAAPAQNVTPAATQATQAAQVTQSPVVQAPVQSAPVTSGGS